MLTQQCVVGLPRCEYCEATNKDCIYPNDGMPIHKEETGSKNKSVEYCNMSEKLVIQKKFVTSDLSRLSDFEVTMVDFFKTRLSFGLGRGSKEIYCMWKYDVPEFALHNSPVVLDAIMAVSSQQIARTREQKLASKMYLHRAIAAHREELMRPEQQRASPESMMITAVLLSVYVMMDPGEITFASPTRDKLDFFGILNGTSVLFDFFEASGELDTSFAGKLLIRSAYEMKEPSIEFDFIQDLRHEVSESLRLGEIDEEEASIYNIELHRMAIVYSIAMDQGILIILSMMFYSIEWGFVCCCRARRPLAMLILAYMCSIYHLYLSDFGVSDDAKYQFWVGQIFEAYKYVPPRLHHMVDRAAEYVTGNRPKHLETFLGFPGEDMKPIVKQAPFL